MQAKWNKIDKKTLEFSVCSAYLLVQLVINRKKDQVEKKIINSNFETLMEAKITHFG